MQTPRQTIEQQKLFQLVNARFNGRVIQLVGSRPHFEVFVDHDVSRKKFGSNFVRKCKIVAHKKAFPRKLVFLEDLLNVLAFILEI